MSKRRGVRGYTMGNQTGEEEKNEEDEEEGEKGYEFGPAGGRQLSSSGPQICAAAIRV